MEGSKLAAAILGEVRRAVVGKDEVLAKVLLAILAGGHILLEDIPGVGVKEPYRRFLENKMREKWDLSGTPINIYIRQK